MSNFTLSPNMNLPVPTIGVDPGPDYATNLNGSLTIIDQHNHSAGSGVQITPSGLDINSDLTAQNNNFTAIRSARFQVQSSALALSTDLGCLYVTGVDLYYNDVNGNQIRLTQSGSIVGTAGSISGLPSGTASASFGGGTFVWQSATNTSATMDFGSAILRNNTASSKGLTLAPPNAMAADYSLTLPSLPVSTKIMALDTSGNITAPYSVDGSTVAISANVIGVPAQGITATQIADQTITQGKLALRATGTTVAAGGVAISASSGTFSTSSTSLVDVTNLSVTITTTGRPVVLVITSDASGNASIMGNDPQGTTFTILRGSSEVFRSQCDSSKVYPTGISTLDPIAAGSYTYKVQMKTNSGGGTSIMFYSHLVAYEL